MLYNKEDFAVNTHCLDNKFDAARKYFSRAFRGFQAYTLTALSFRERARLTAKFHLARK